MFKSVRQSVISEFVEVQQLCVTVEIVVKHLKC